MQGSLLFPGTGVGRTTIRGQTTFIAHTDGVLVVMLGMCPRQVLMTCLVHMTIAGDVVVVAGEPETGIVTGNEVLDRKPAVAARRAAMNND